MHEFRVVDRKETAIHDRKFYLRIFPTGIPTDGRSTKFPRKFRPSRLAIYRLQKYPYPYRFKLVKLNSVSNPRERESR